MGEVAASRVKWFYLEGYTQGEIAASYGIDQSMVSRIVTGDNYEGVDH